MIQIKSYFLKYIKKYFILFIYLFTVEIKNKKIKITFTTPNTYTYNWSVIIYDLTIVSIHFFTFSHRNDDSIVKVVTRKSVTGLFLEGCKPKYIPESGQIDYLTRQLTLYNSQ